MITMAGVYDTEEADYHADKLMDGPTLSSGIVRLLDEASPLHAWTAHPRLNPDHATTNSNEFDLGKAAHAMILEGEDRITTIDAKDWRTNEAKALRDAAYAAGKIPLLAKHRKDVVAMVEAVNRQLDEHEEARDAFTVGEPEKTLVWQEQGVWCRARLDWLPFGSAIFTDLKSTGMSANPAAWTRGPLFSNSYDIQGDFYLRGIRAVLGVRNPTFRFCIVETTPPYALSVVALGEGVLTLARKKVDRAIAQWAECLETGKWPGYPTRMAWAELPPYMVAKFEERQEREMLSRPIEEYLNG